MSQTRFIRRGVTRIRFSATSPANINAPTRAEINASTELTAYIATITGWTVENTKVAVPDLGSTFEKNIPGQDAAADSSFEFYEDQVSQFLEGLLPKGQTGFIWMFRKGDVSGQNTLDIFPVRVAANQSEYSTGGTDPAKLKAQFVITDVPTQGVTIP